MSESIENVLEINKAYKQAIEFTKSHYENFPVLSFFISKKLRKHVAVVYQFARQADDIADEGKLDDNARIKKLDEYLNNFEAALRKNFTSNFWLALQNTITEKNLDPQNFRNLITAFKQDLVIKKYESYKDLLGYCQNSANPVGRIILELNQIKSEEANKYSDNICTALQLTNFYQDVSLDIKKGRVYIPQEDFELFEINDSIITKQNVNNSFKNLIKYEIERTKQLFDEGKKLLKYLPLRLRLQIMVTIKGGESILEKIESSNYDVLTKRPKLTKSDFLILFSKAIILRK